MARQASGSGLDVNGIGLGNVFNNIVGESTKEKKNDIPAKVQTESGLESKVISIDLLDEDENNEYLNGYDDIATLRNSFEENDDNGGIHVYERKNGHYLVWSGNTRLKVARERKEKELLVIVTGPEPEDEFEKHKRRLAMNQGRQDRPLYIARNIAEYEKGLNRKGVRGDIRNKELEKAFSMPARNIQRYKRILNLNDELQLLFKYPQKDIPYIAMIDKVIPKIPEDKAAEFASAFNTVMSDGEEMSSARLEQLFDSIVKGVNTKKTKDTTIKVNQILKQYKALLSVEYDDDGIIVVNEEKKDLILREAEELKNNIEDIIEAYK
ncbi:hypothetical protein SAMN02910384_02440 [Pseudobutyrivibrio sp. ACV-2]|uniref:hypothetical protein n=1 Tax=Pseudobutyrivibrio sp. ACV-2 TaxID=1520801 RepID=UPI000897117D|nr:hypothetical protein [Pseudobutyrivibrio sp. ACV-2]SEA82749.1 hypothetical protein SAMN02910384_02440 [Pseudobutyrivibrio sp. ACV-2]